MKKYKNVKVEYESCYFDIEISDEDIKFAQNCGIDINDDEELVKFYLENNFTEYMDLLEIDDYDFEIEED